MIFVTAWPEASNAESLNYGILLVMISQNDYGQGGCAEADAAIQ